MLTTLELENFKGIATRQHVDFAPLTLLFGANSAGKSTILQALLYLHELLERGSADVDRTELGGNVIELGGFARLVHRHEVGREIVLRVEFTTPGGLERFGRDLAEFPFPDLDDEVESAWLELTIRFRTATSFRGPIVDRAVVGLGSSAEPAVWLETGPTLRDGEPLHARVNLGHPLLVAGAARIVEAWDDFAIPETVWRRELERDGDGTGNFGLSDDSGFGDGRSLPVFAVSRQRQSCLPRIDEPLRIIPFGDVDDLREELQNYVGQNASQADQAHAQELIETMRSRERAQAQVRTFLEMVVLGTTSHLLDSLREAIYIGPLRTIPPRGFLYERAGRAVSWADGLAAWDLLLADRGNLVERTNDWLERLNVGCKIAVQQLFDRDADAEDLSDGHVDKVVRRLLLDTGTGSLVLPSEVGAGISQVIPVVVAALQGRAGLTLVEQPEIHIHPAVQVGIGDLLIDAVRREGGRRSLLIETHSEHIILRLLRRIRQTTENELSEGGLAFSEDKLSVLYVESSPEGVRVRRLRVNELGEFVDRWPKGFFAERIEEML